jgi:predicted RNase H-like HicB family nuclease
MDRYLALVDGEAGAYGVIFPDLPGCNAMGDTLDEALANAALSLRDYVADALEHGEPVAPPRALEDLRRDAEVVEALASGSSLANVALVMETGRAVKANLSLDEGVLSAIDQEAKRRKLTRSAFVELMARRVLRDVA